MIVLPIPPMIALDLMNLSTYHTDSFNHCDISQLTRVLSLLNETSICVELMLKVAPGIRSIPPFPLVYLNVLFK